MIDFVKDEPSQDSNFKDIDETLNIADLDEHADEKPSLIHQSEINAKKVNRIGSFTNDRDNNILSKSVPKHLLSIDRKEITSPAHLDVNSVQSQYVEDQKVNFLDQD